MNFPDALTACVELVDRHRGTNTLCEGRALLLLAKIKWSNGNYSQSVEMLREAKAIARKEADAEMLSEIDILIADNFYYQAYYDSAIKYYQLARITQEQAGDTHELMFTYHKLAVMYHRKGEMSKALRNLYRSEELKGATPGQTHDLADFGGSSSLFYDTLYYRTKIKEEFQQLALFRKGKNQRGEYNTLLNLGIAHQQLGDHLSAARFMAKGATLMSLLGLYPLWHSAGREYGAANKKDSCFYFHYRAKAEFPKTTQIKKVTTLELLGDSHALFGNLDSAAWYLEYAYELNRQMNNRITIPSIMGKLAKVYYRMGRTSQAEELIHKGIAQARGASRQHLLSLYEFGKKFYMETGDPAQALVFSEQAKALSDSINRAEGAMGLAYYQAHFESVRKERELEEAQLVVRNRTIILTSVAAFSVLAVAWGATLFFQRRKIARQNRLLKLSNDEQRALMQEVHHRVKNNLQYIVSLLNLQAQAASSQELTGNIEEIKNRIMTMGLIHQRLYQAQGIQRIDVAPFVQELVSNLMKALPPHQPVTKHVRIDSVEVDIDTAISLGLLINEFITNSVKHAFSKHDSPELVLSVVREGKDLVLRIGDNGPGFHFPGNGSGFGMQLIALLIRKLNGRAVQPDSKSVEIRMPLDAVSKRVEYAQEV